MAIAKSVFIHESSYVDKPVNIGENTKIWHFCHISKNAWIRNNCKIGQNVFIGENVKIGNNVKIQNNVSVYEGVTIEDDVFIGPSVVFTNVLRPRSEYPINCKYDKTVVKRGTTVGANATIVCGHTIGIYSFIGAGSVVTRDVSDFQLCAGAPAKHKGWVCQCGNKLFFKRANMKCVNCGAVYRKNKNGGLF